MRNRRRTTPLTQSNRSAGRRKKKAKSKAARNAPLVGSRSVLRKTCEVCGETLKSGRKRFCSKCRDVGSRKGLAVAKRKLREKREAGTDPAHGGEAARKRGIKSAAMQRANFEWEKKHGSEVDPSQFEREIAPHLDRILLSALVKATGLSQPYCAKIRRGAKVPHPRHWEAIRKLGQRATRPPLRSRGGSPRE